MSKILVFIPMYNCENQITRVLSQFDKETSKYIDEIIVVNNRSTDNGENKVIEYAKKNKHLNITLLRNDDNYNLGGSHKIAFDYALKNKYEYLIVLHGDDQGDIKDIVPYLKDETYKDYDCLLGSRFMKNSKFHQFIIPYWYRIYSMPKGNGALGASR